MSTYYHGLSDAEVLKSREANGANILLPPPKTPLWKQYLEKFEDPLIIVLLVAGILSLGISFYEYKWLEKPLAVFFEPSGIFMAIFLATGLAFIFDLKANREFELLNQVNDDEPVQVIRNGHTTCVPKKDIVVGDIILINTGAEVPADAELIEAVCLTMDESSLTGEPSCQKTIDVESFDKEATFPSNHVMRGTKVMEGHGVAKVFAVGPNTENGKVFEAAQIDDSVKTPLNEQLERLSDLITKASYIIAGLVLVGRVLVYFFTSHAFFSVDFLAYLLQSVMIAVTLIVVAVPEGLPMAVTLSLAYSMRRMLQTKNLVRRMHACETMGAATVICTDKTGTLTRNQMTVNDAEFYGPLQTTDGKIDPLIVESIALNSTASLDTEDANKPVVIGNPTEGALLLWLWQHGIDYQKVREQARVLEEVPFSTFSKFMAALVKSSSGQEILFVKGAPEIVKDMCAQVSGNVDDATIKKQLLDFQNKAMRTIGFAYQIMEPGEKAIDDGKIVANKLIFMGIVAIADPVRSDVPDAIAECRNAGIKVKIVTGDTPGTAREIGRQIGLWNEGDDDSKLLTGPEFAALSDDEVKNRVCDLKIIARARPMDKERLVRALQDKNEVVAVTGDGTNDAPALKAAHVGLSMGDGTSVAKEASDITIIDNSFASIGRAVMWGRSLYRNIQRFILFQMTVNVAACLTVLVGAFMGTESPLTVTQMLWINLIMDSFAAMALASLPPSHDVMRENPRNRADFIISPPIRNRIIGVGFLFSIFLIYMVWVLEHANITTLSGLFAGDTSGGTGLTPYKLSLFFTIFVMLQFWNMFNAKAFGTGRSALHFKGCGWFLLILGIILIGQIGIINVGGEFFNVVPIHFSDWIIIIIGTSAVLWIGEIARYFGRKDKNN